MEEKLEKKAKTAKKTAEEAASAEKEAKFMEKLQGLLAVAKKKKNMLEYQEINDYFRELELNAEQFEKILYMPISSGLSGSYETAMMLAKDEAYEGRVLVVDDGQVAAPLHQMVLDTLDMIEKGYEAEQIRDLLERAGDRMMIYIALQTLEFLKKGGRVTPAAAALGSVFNIKPIL